MSFDAYTIAVKLTLVNGLSAGLASIATRFVGLHGQVGKTNAELSEMERKLKTIGKMTLVGGALAAGGVGMLHMLKGPYEEAKKLAQAQADFQTLNLTAAENSETFAKAAALSHSVLGTTITQNIKNIHDLHTAFGDLHHAIGTSEMFTKMSLVAKVANGGKDVDGLITAAAKALEHRGGKVVNDPKAFDTEANMMTQVMLGTKMRVSPKDYLTASGTGKMAYQLYDKEFLYGNYAGLMSINGGMRTGTEGMTAFSSLIGGHMDNKGKGFLSELGLWEEGVSPKRLKLMREATKGMSKEDMKSMGMLAPTTGGMSDANSEAFAHRPDLFIANVLVPAIKKRFGMDLDDEQMGLLVAKYFNKSTGSFLGTQITMAQKLGKDTGIIQKSMDIGQGLANYMKSPEGAEEAADAAWRNFLAMFGTVYLPTITSGLLKLAEGLDSLSQWMTAHPNLTNALVVGFVALGSAMAIGGTLTIAAAGFKALSLAIGAGVAGGAGGVGLVGALRGALGPLGLVIGLLVTLGLMAADAARGHEWDKSINDDKSARNADGTPNKKNFSRRGHWSGAQIPLTEGVVASSAGAGRGSGDYVRPAPQASSESSRPVQLVLKDGGRPLAEVVSSQQAKRIGTNLGSGSYDLGVSQPAVNVRTN